MHPSVHSHIIYNCQDTEATYVFINRWMDKDVVYVYTMGFYSAVKKEWNFAIYEVDGLGGHDTK